LENISNKKILGKNSKRIKIIEEEKVVSGPLKESETENIEVKNNPKKRKQP
jgi:hypothetical protein